MMSNLTEVEQLSGRTTPMGTEEYLLDKFKKEGVSEGEHNKVAEMALKLIAKSIARDEIAELTGLSIEEIEAL